MTFAQVLIKNPSNLDGITGSVCCRGHFWEKLSRRSMFFHFHICPVLTSAFCGASVCLAVCYSTENNYIDWYNICARILSVALLSTKRNLSDMKIRKYNYAISRLYCLPDAVVTFAFWYKFIQQLSPCSYCKQSDYFSILRTL